MTRNNGNIDTTVSKALKLNSEGKGELAISLMEELIANSDEQLIADDPVLLAILGSIYYTNSNYADAIKLMRRYQKYKPASEKASCVIFHSLNNIEKPIEAMEELKIFLTNYELKKGSYIDILKDLKEGLDNNKDSEYILPYKDLIIETLKKYSS